jgi:hypothetical protein
MNRQGTGGTISINLDQTPPVPLGDWPSLLSVSERLAERPFRFSKRRIARRKHRMERTDLSAEILNDYQTVAVAKLDVDDRGVLICPILVGFGGNLTCIFVVEQRRCP